MKAREIMSSTIQSVGLDDSTSQAAKIMSQQNIGSIPVCTGSQLHGIVTDRDIVVRCVAQEKNCSSTKASEIMTPNPVTASPDMDVHEVSQLMASNQIRRLPVVENGQLCGMVALGDLAVVQIHENEAGEALGDISQGIQH